MKKIITIFLFLLTIFIFNKIVFVSNSIIIEKNKIFDGNNKIYFWRGDGNCGQDEGMPPMFIMKDNTTLKNIYIINAPDGVHIKGSNIIIDRMINLNVCEDAVSTPKEPFYKNIKIINSIFLFCEDKGLQFNNGDNFIIRDNKFIICSQPIRLPKKSQNYKLINNYTSGVGSGYYLK
jgi:hypothetical protein